MDIEKYSNKDQNIKESYINSPHVVILGAGCSKAAFPDGDKNNKALPLMNNIFSILKMEDIFNKYDLKVPTINFEEYYSSIYDKTQYNPLREELEERIYSYFKSLSIPDYPTIYDYLVLSLQEKDLIATFNWDPFLYDACQRNYKVKPLPQIVYLHGNVRIGMDSSGKEIGLAEGINSKTGNKFIPTQLLYPIENKDYSKDIFIAEQWRMLENYLSRAYYLTIFGFGAPSSDIKAVKLLEKCWTSTPSRIYSEMEVIDIVQEEIIKKRWKKFLYSHHFSILNDFFTSSIARNPNKTTEELFESTMEVMFTESKPLPINVSLVELQEIVKANY